MDAWNPLGLFKLCDHRDDIYLRQRSAPEITLDAILYYHPDGEAYVGCIEGSWYQWPAVAGGWRSLKRTGDPSNDQLEEIADPVQINVALRTTGVIGKAVLAR